MEAQNYQSVTAAVNQRFIRNIMGLKIKISFTLPANVFEMIIIIY